MNIRDYYNRQRAIYDKLGEDWIVIVSEQTEDGGRAGLRSEVDRSLAAKLIVEGRARLADPEESASYRREINRGRVKVEPQRPVRS